MGRGRELGLRKGFSLSYTPGPAVLRGKLGKKIMMRLMLIPPLCNFITQGAERSEGGV